MIKWIYIGQNRIDLRTEACLVRQTAELTAPHQCDRWRATPHRLGSEQVPPAELAPCFVGRVRRKLDMKFEDGYAGTHDGRTMGTPTCSVCSSCRESMKPSGWGLMFGEHLDIPSFQPASPHMGFLPATKL